MPNSSFKKLSSIKIPVSVPNGGTGRTSLDNKSVLVGAGAGNISMVPPGPSGSALISDGTSFTSSGIIPADGAITYNKIASDLNSTVSMSSNDIDWSSGSIFRKTLTSNTNLTFSNYQLNKTITLIVSGNYYLKFPKTAKTIIGVYNGTVTNYITLYCIRSASVQEVLCTISQRAPIIVSPFGLFGGGYTSTWLNYTEKYTYAGDTIASGTVLGMGRSGPSATGNATLGIFAGGYNGTINTTYTDKYVYSGDTVSAGTVLGIGKQQYGSTGNSTVGIFAGGWNGSSYIANSDKYTYSGDTRVAGTSLGLSRGQLAGTGNSTVGIFGAGLVTDPGYTYTDRYTYSGDTVAAGTALGLARYSLGATGNSTTGYFLGGYSPSSRVYTDKYTYASNTVVVGTNLGAIRSYIYATGNSSLGIVGGNTTYTDKYTYSGDTVVAGSALSLSRQNVAACSSKANGL